MGVEQLERIYLIYLIIESLLIYCYLKLIKNNETDHLINTDSIAISKYKGIGKIIRFHDSVSIRVVFGRIFLYISYIIYIFFSVFKEVNPLTSAHDAFYYKDRFEKINECSSWFTFLFREDHEFEIGFESLYFICKKISVDYHFFLWILFTCIFFLYIRFLKNIYTKTNSLLPIAAVFLLLISQFNTMRMTLSIGIALQMILIIQKQKWKTAAFLAVLAISCHITAIILIPIIIVNYMVVKIENYVVVNRFKINFTKLKLIIIAGMVLAVALIPIMNILLSGSSKEEYVGSSGSLAYGNYTIVFVITVLAVYRYKSFCRLSDVNKTFIVTLPICLCCIPLQYSVQMIYRMILFFNPLILGSIPSILKTYSKKNNVIDLGVTLFMYFYVLVRIYSFFTEELKYVGIYSNTLLPWLK